MSLLPTDVVNLDEIHTFHVRRAVIFFDTQKDHGYSEGAARTQALAYLRRKTHWPEPVAAGALDFQLLTRRDTKPPGVPTCPTPHD